MFLVVMAALAANVAPPVRKATPPPPLVRIQPLPPIATKPTVTAARFGQWRTTNMGDSVIASTANESGSAFGLICGTSCVWFINTQIECKKGDTYPAMINAASGSNAIELKCYHYGNVRLMTFAVTDDNGPMVDTGAEIGFAIPHASGKFGVSRFSLSGATLAVDKALEIMTSKRNANQQGLRDFTI